MDQNVLKMVNRMLLPVLVAVVIVAFFLMWGNRRAFTDRERQIIDRSDSVMYVTVLPLDSALLRTPSMDLTERELRSEELRTLVAKMLRTVQDPSQDGVGIAAPQVGIDKRVIWVQRFDKPGEPFECYLNPHLERLPGEVQTGPEGCLSVPPMRGLVSRAGTVIVSYIHPETLLHQRDTVRGYTAVIFQHECDHLDGILYIDRADTLFVSEPWAAERLSFDYSRPAWWR